jgi:hypothetical protein
MVFSQAASDPVTWVQFGVTGMVIGALLTGWLWAKPAVDRLIKDKEHAEAQRDRLLTVYEERIMPTMGEAVGTLKEVAPALAEIKIILQQVQEQRVREGK